MATAGYGFTAFQGLALGVGLVVVLVVVTAAVLIVRRREKAASEEEALNEDPYYSAAIPFRLSRAGADHGGPPRSDGRENSPSSVTVETQGDDPHSGFI
jgi:hypothetical protein